MSVLSRASDVGVRTVGRRWRTVDIVVAAVVAALFGAVYWGWGYFPASKVFSFFPPMSGLLNTVFLLAGPVGALIIRKPGAALFTEAAAALFEALISTQWSGSSIIVYGLVQGAAAELAFLLFAYKVWRLPVALLSGMFTGAAMAVLDLWIYRYYPDWSSGYQLSYLIAGAVGGLILAGAMAWYLVRSLAVTGVLAPFSAGRTQRLVG
ncbi:MAG: ECF transporter S component [Jatrophihabitans sp.]